MNGVALNVNALVDLERAAEAMIFSFSQIEQRDGYRAALKAFNYRKRRLREALATFKARGFARTPDLPRGAPAPEGNPT